MKKETELIRVPKKKKYTEWKFELSHKDIILSSIKAYGYKKGYIEDEVKIQIYLCPNTPPIVTSSNLLFKDYDAILVKYDIVQEATKLTIEAEDYVDILADLKGNYTFYMENAEVNI